MAYDYVVRFNLDDTIKRLGLDEQGRVQNFVTSEVLRLSEPFIPLREGNLIGSGHVEGTDVVWATPYARRLYYHPEYNFNEKGDSENGGVGRGAYWVDRMLQNGGMLKIENGARKLVKV